jgi:hypothetical protein
MTTLGLGTGTIVCWCTLPIKYSSIAWVISNSDITPSLNGRTASKFAGVRPTISFASAPMLIGSRVLLSIATQEGSLITIPFPRTFTMVFAVPKSMPISRENSPSSQLNGLNANEGSLLINQSDISFFVKLRGLYQFSSKFTLVRTW